jgi:hypothetical protein
MEQSADMASMALAGPASPGVLKISDTRLKTTAVRFEW